MGMQKVIVPNRVTYWAPQASGELFQEPFCLPQHFDVVTLEDDGGISVDSKGTTLECSGFLFGGISQAADPRKVEGAYEITDVGVKSDLRKLRQLQVVYLEGCHVRPLGG